MRPAALFRRPYLEIRARVRAFVVKRPLLDNTVGRMLVRADALLRGKGIISLLDSSTVEFSFQGLTFQFDKANRQIAEAVVSTGTYEPETVESLTKLLQPGDTFVDLGANIGIFTLLAARKVGTTGRVFAFEPTPATVALLRRNLAVNSLEARTTVVEQAVSRKPGRARFSLHEAAQGNAITVAGDTAVEYLDVDVTSLDAYFEALGWPKVDVIKMDVEGQEVPALEGMHGLTRRYPGLKLIFEYHDGQLARTGISGRTLIDAARAAGFDSFEVLFRTSQRLELPADMPVLDRLTKRAAFNILAWRAH